LFEVLVLRPWVALNFGGTEHCIRVGTGSRDHDPESMRVRPLSPDPREDAAARWRLSKDGELYAGAKHCVDNTIRYADHFLRYPLGSDDRDAEYEAINRADPSKVPASDPAKATYKPAVVDKPATDAMEKGGQYQRLLLALVILLGELGTVLLVGSLSVSVLLAQMVVAGRSRRALRLVVGSYEPVQLVAQLASRSAASEPVQPASRPCRARQWPTPAVLSAPETADAAAAGSCAKSTRPAVACRAPTPTTPRRTP
jgi:hypothetical protein